MKNMFLGSVFCECGYDWLSLLGEKSPLLNRKKGTALADPSHWILSTSLLSMEGLKPLPPLPEITKQPRTTLPLLAVDVLLPAVGIPALNLPHSCYLTSSSILSTGLHLLPATSL